MTPLILALTAALIATLAGLLGRSDADRSSWQWAFTLVLVILVTIAGANEYQRDGFETQRVAVAMDHNDNIVTSVLVMTDEKGDRIAHRFTLSRSIPWAKDLFTLLLGSVWLAFIALLWTRRTKEGQASVMGTVWIALTGLTGLLVWSVLASQGNGVGEQGVRSVLAHYDVTGLQSFSVPTDAWRYVSSLTGCALVSFLIAILGLVNHWMPAIELKYARYGLGAAALLALVACGFQLVLVGGLPWRPVEGILWATALLLGGAWLEDGHRLSRCLPCILALGICGMAIG